MKLIHSDCHKELHGAVVETAQRMTGKAKRESALNEDWRNIAEYGFHTYVVTGSGKPHYGYTIGLTESLGRELILAGAYFYRLMKYRV